VNASSMMSRAELSVSDVTVIVLTSVQGLLAATINDKLRVIVEISMNASSWEGWMAQLAAAHDEVVEDIKSKFREFREAPSFIDSVRAFCAAIDWTVRHLDCCFGLSLFSMP